METFSALLALCEGNPAVTGAFPSRRPVTLIFMFSLIWAWTNLFANNRDSGDLRRHRAPYNVIVIHLVRWGEGMPYKLLGYPGNRLTKAHDATMQRYRNNTQKLKVVFCGAWVQFYLWNFIGTRWNFTQTFEPIHHKIETLRGVKSLTNYDMTS